MCPQAKIPAQLSLPPSCSLLYPFILSCPFSSAAGKGNCVPSELPNIHFEIYLPLHRIHQKSAYIFISLLPPPPPFLFLSLCGWWSTLFLRLIFIWVVCVEICDWAHVLNIGSLPGHKSLLSEFVPDLVHSMQPFLTMMEENHKTPWWKSHLTHCAFYGQFLSLHCI